MIVYQANIRAFLGLLLVLVGLAQGCAGEEPAAPGTITGKLCFPSDYIPAMTIYARNADNRDTVSVTMPENSQAYAMEVPAGTYEVFAWTVDGLGGTYSQFVPCGMSVECTDHSLVPVTVPAGQTVGNVDVCDFYGGPVPEP